MTEEVEGIIRFIRREAKRYKELGRTDLRELDQAWVIRYAGARDALRGVAKAIRKKHPRIRP